jgi:hypothetical protein
MKAAKVFVSIVLPIALNGCAGVAKFAREYDAVVRAREQREMEARQERQQQYITKLKNQCEQYGAREGSSEMVGCVLRLQQFDAQNAAQNEAQNEAAYQQSLQNAARILRESTTPIMVPQPADNSMNCRSYRNGNEIITNCR